MHMTTHTAAINIPSVQHKYHKYNIKYLKKYIISNIKLRVFSALTHTQLPLAVASRVACHPGYRSEEAHIFNHVKFCVSLCHSYKLRPYSNVLLLSITRVLFIVSLPD